ncbi:MAG TPA: ribonuclease Z [Ferruginibacter sp.]|nr:ribonuclease Z [Ferruginibacter sp.]
MLSLTILGSNSAIPAHGRNPTAQVLQNQDDCYLIDCGEGTQLQLARYKIKRSKISHIFISHLHGDHYFGLIGLLTSMGLIGRVAPLHLHGPALLIDIINLQLKAADTKLPYEINFHPLGEEGVISDDKKIRVECFKVNHRIDCWGFIFREKKNPRSIDPVRAKAYEIPASYYEALQKGADYTNKKGTIIPNSEVTSAASSAKSYAYCADTIYNEQIATIVKEVDLLYHEATYLKDLEQRAAERYHSTTQQAARIAQLAEAKKLIIGHFSSKYDELDSFLTEAREVFDNCELALEGTCFKI